AGMHAVVAVRGSVPRSGPVRRGAVGPGPRGAHVGRSQDLGRDARLPASLAGRAAVLRRVVDLAPGAGADAGHTGAVRRAVEVERRMNRMNLALHALNRLGRWAQLRLGTAGIAGIVLLLVAGIGLAVATLAAR